MTVGSYRILSRGLIAIVLLAAVAVVGAHFSGVRPVHPAVKVVAAHHARRNRWEQVETSWSGPRGARPLRVLVVGASVSHGLGASTPRRDYVSDLRRMLQRRTHRPVSITVWSRPGARVLASAHWRLPRNQQVVITQLITNDFIDGTPLLGYRHGAVALLKRIRATSPRAHLLCVGAWEPAYAVDRTGIPVAAYDAIDRAACQARGASYLSPSSIFQVTADRGPLGRPTAFGRGDDFHPNNLGHERLATAIFGQLERHHAVPLPAAREVAKHHPAAG